jgi:hypothetical protein
MKCSTNEQPRLASYWPLAMASALALLSAACGDSDDYYYDPYEDYYAYAYGYPADLAYADSYWVDDWYAPYYAYSSLDTRSKGTSNSDSPAGFLRNLSLGEDLCPGQISVTPTPGSAQCSNSTAMTSNERRAGATMVFDGCALPSGGRLDGSLTIEGSQTFSDDICNNDTLVSVTYTSTSTNMSYTAPSGAKIVAPSLFRMGSYTRVLDGSPAAISVSSSGTLQRFASDGSLMVEATLSGTQNLTLDEEDPDSYRLDGTLKLTDTTNARAVTIAGDDVLRIAGCCRPTDGTITVRSSPGDTNTWRFGPSCGDLSLNGEKRDATVCLFGDF